MTTSLKYSVLLDCKNWRNTDRSEKQVYWFIYSFLFHWTAAAVVLLQVNAYFLVCLILVCPLTRNSSPSSLPSFAIAHSKHSPCVLMSLTWEDEFLLHDVDIAAGSAHHSAEHDLLRVVAAHPTHPPPAKYAVLGFNTVFILHPGALRLGLILYFMLQMVI